MFAAQVAMNQAPQTVGIATTLGTGILHGCSGSGHLLGVMPALAMPSWSVATTYLVMFGIGTRIAMSMFTAAVGTRSLRAALASKPTLHGHPLRQILSCARFCEHTVDIVGPSLTRCACT